MVAELEMRNTVRSLAFFRWLWQAWFMSIGGKRWSGVILLLAACGGQPKAGDACRVEGDMACGQERTVLHCQGTTFVLAYQGCGDCDHVSGDPTSAACKDSGGNFHVVFAVRDAFCLKSGAAACATDHSAVLVCNGNRWIAQTECARGCGRSSSVSPIRCN